MPKLDNFLTCGGAVLAAFAFFRIDAIAISDSLSAMSGLTALLIVGLVICAVGLFLKWREKKVTPRNVRQKIRQWLDTFNLEHGKFDYEPWYFTFKVTFSNQPIFVGRPRTLAGRYIEIQLRTNGVMPDHRKAFDAMSQSEKSQFYGQLALETAKSRISFNANPELSDIIINKHFPITNNLTESDIINGLTQVYQSGVIIWNTIALRLSESPILKQLSLTPNAEGPSGTVGASTQPLLTPDKEVSPPSQA